MLRCLVIIRIVRTGAMFNLLRKQLCKPHEGDPRLGSRQYRSEAAVEHMMSRCDPDLLSLARLSISHCTYLALQITPSSSEEECLDYSQLDAWC